MLHTLAGIGALLAALVGRWLLLDDDTELAPGLGWPVGRYRACGHQCGEWVFARGRHQRVLLTRRLPLWVRRSEPN